MQEYIRSNDDPKIAIVGLGYVGLPLALEFSKHFKVVGFDLNKKRVKSLNENFDNTQEVDFEELKKSKLKTTSDLNQISNSDIYIITVPTPVDKHKKPDMSFLEKASVDIGKHLNKGNIVIYESTVYPGATEDFCVPLIEKNSGLKYNKDFYCGYSPERINPGDKKNNIRNIKKIVSGSTPDIANYINELYKKIIPAGTFLTSAIPVAEAAKVIENIQRDVNIALANELAMIFNKLNLDANEIIDAASSKWNFAPFRPGLVGGHCIGVDPYYLTQKAIEVDYYPEMILAGRKINEKMSEYISNSTLSLLSKKGISSIEAKIGILGMTFKENCPDIRNTKVLDLISSLRKFNCELTVTDCVAKKEDVKKLGISLVSIDEIKNCHAIILAVAHDEYKSINMKHWKKMLNKSGIIIDVKAVYDKNYFKSEGYTHWRL